MLVGYHRTNGLWEGPERIAPGFMPGGHVTATLALNTAQQPNLMVVAVDEAGRVQALRREEFDWVPRPIEQVPLPPGAPVSLALAADGLHLSAVTRGGAWVDWSPVPGGFVPSEIGSGFPVGAPVVLLSHETHLHGFCTDAAGRLAAASRFNGVWRLSLFVPEFKFAPRLVSRRVVPNNPLPPVMVQFDNRFTEELLVVLVEGGAQEATDSGSKEFKIAPGRSVAQRLNRDAGAVLEEAWQVPTPDGTWVENVKRTALLPQSLYRVTVAASRTTYRYRDRRKQPGPLKNFDMKSPVSLGVFRLPPGAALNEGDMVDVYREAVSQHNTGAAIDIPRP